MSVRASGRRVVVTGIGAVTPLALNIHDTWSKILAGEGGIDAITRFDASDFQSRIAGELKGFDVLQWLPSKIEAQRVDLFIHYGLAAAQMAFDDSGLGSLDGELADRTGVYAATGAGGVQLLVDTYEKFRQVGPRHGFSPFFVTGSVGNLLAGRISMRLGACGPSFCHVSACASAAHAVGEASLAIRYGQCDVVVAGGAEAPISPVGIGSFCAMRALSTRNDEPDKASRPFDRDHGGFVMAEGSAMLVLEELQHARRRGARIYGEIVGCGATSDATHITHPAPRGRGGRKAMGVALEDAQVDVSEVDYINAHATSTPIGDIYETQAIRDLFGHEADRLAVSSTKGATGHLLGAVGALEAIFTVLSVYYDVLPPTRNLEVVDPKCDQGLNYVSKVARDAQVRVALSNSFGFGGTNACLAVSKLR